MNNRISRIATPKVHNEESNNGFSRAFKSEGGSSSLQKLVQDNIKAKDNELKNIPIELLLDYPNHHYKAYSGEKFDNLCDSIERLGLHEPLIVNYVENKYYILSGHNRRNALMAVYEKTQDEKFAFAPCIVKNNLPDTLAELIVQETNLSRRNFEDMDLQEKCENVHAYYDAVYNFYQENKNNIPKGFQTREEVGKRLGMNYKTVERYNRIYNTFSKNPEYYSFCPDSFDFSTAYEICKLDASGLNDLFNVLSNSKKNDKVIKIKNPQIKDLLAIQTNKGGLVAEDISKVLVDKVKSQPSSSNSSTFDFKIPIQESSKYYDKIKNLNQEDMSMLEMNIINAITRFFDNKNN